MKLLVCDLDGVVADNTARMQKAEEAKQAYLAQAGRYTGIVEGNAKDIYWLLLNTNHLLIPVPVRLIRSV